MSNYSFKRLLQTSYLISHIHPKISFQGHIKSYSKKKKKSHLIRFVWGGQDLGLTWPLALGPWMMAANNKSAWGNDASITLTRLNQPRPDIWGAHAQRRVASWCIIAQLITRKMANTKRFIMWGSVIMLKRTPATAQQGGTPARVQRQKPLISPLCIYVDLIHRILINYYWSCVADAAQRLSTLYMVVV